ncbi:hypothetical protein CTEN210_12441 [Chaetoceros tenuissimus]|uniref:Myb-like domain-containing protein n=1 Tax=Chaetoceros tenuissimus TaxID=426638 RepID=A0AAD3D3E2_9STRA|nr:hypothetical protein CTEN210_12441 [Chaetoceros tenuissimus]
MADKKEIGPPGKTVPDLLMNVYESLTQNKRNQDDGHESKKAYTEIQEVKNRNASIHSTHDTHVRRENEQAIERQSSHEVHQEITSNTDMQLHLHDPLIQEVAAMSVPSSGDSISSADRRSSMNSSSSRASRSRRSKRSLREEISSQAESSTKSRKKKEGDNRWSKRFNWPEKLHRDFVSAIFDVGLKNSSPSSILENMVPDDKITTERIKSHLQKYRLHRMKSKKEFMESFESTIVQMKSGQHDTDPTSLSSGEVAAHLAFATLNDQEVDDDAKGGILQLLKLTEEEMKSPTGSSMAYLTGLFLSLKEQLYEQRRNTANTKKGQGQLPPSYSNNVGLPTTTATSATLALPHNTPHTLPRGVSQYQHSSENFTEGAMYQSNNHRQSFQNHYGSVPSNQDASTNEVVHSATNTNYSPSEATSNVTTFEEGNAMRQDMARQMVFQTKMRELMNNEMEKYSTSPAEGTKNHTDSNILQPQQSIDSKDSKSTDIQQMDMNFHSYEEMLDDQLFEFLMND